MTLARTISIFPPMADDGLLGKGKVTFIDLTPVGDDVQCEFSISVASDVYSLEQAEIPSGTLVKVNRIQDIWVISALPDLLD